MSVAAGPDKDPDKDITTLDMHELASSSSYTLHFVANFDSKFCSDLVNNPSLKR